MPLICAPTASAVLRRSSDKVTNVFAGSFLKVNTAELKTLHFMSNVIQLELPICISHPDGLILVFGNQNVLTVVHGMIHMNNFQKNQSEASSRHQIIFP
jgi:hypothetical protein